MSYQNGGAQKTGRVVLFIIATLAASTVVASTIFGGWSSARNALPGKREQTPVGHNQALTERTEMDNSQSTPASEGAHEVQTRVGAVKPGDPANNDLINRPDLPLRGSPRMPVAPKFLIEHRSALKGKTVRVRGYVVAMPDRIGENSPAGYGTTANANPQPRVFLSDASGKNRDRNYDLMIMLREGDDDYKVGARVEIKGVVEAGRNTVYLRKTY